jgi:hypothetical protein
MLLNGGMSMHQKAIERASEWVKEELNKVNEHFERLQDGKALN